MAANTLLFRIDDGVIADPGRETNGRARYKPDRLIYNVYVSSCLAAEIVKSATGKRREEKRGGCGSHTL